jgi:hypothetical protein
MDLWKKIEAEIQAKRLAMWQQLAQDQQALAEKACLDELEAEKARLLAKNPGDELEIVEGDDYEVRDLNGAFRFKTWKLMRGRQVVKSNRAGLPRRNGDSAAKTSDWRDLTLRRVSGDTSIRAHADTLNRLVPPEAKISHITLANGVEREGLALDAALDEAVAKVGVATPLPEADLAVAKLDEAEVKQLVKDTVPKAYQKEALVNPVPLTDPKLTVILTADAVFCKKQVEERGPVQKDAEGNRIKKPRPSRRERKQAKAERGGRKTVSTACGTLSAPGQGKVTLVARSYATLFIRFLALMQVRDLRGINLCLFSDGEKLIRESALTILSGKVKGFHQILDWYHLHKKLGELLSPALKDIDRRAKEWSKLEDMLYHGAVDSAIAHLRSIQADQIRNPKKIQELIDYLEARRDQIPVYSIRKKLGLPLSSNPAEKACHLCVSQRQKGRGMAWSADGSYALAVIRATIVSGWLKSWLDSSSIELKAG